MQIFKLLLDSKGKEDIGIVLTVLESFYKTFFLEQMLACQAGGDRIQWSESLRLAQRVRQLGTVLTNI